jgi:hypothetical protein
MVPSSRFWPSVKDSDMFKQSCYKGGTKQGKERVSWMSHRKVWRVPSSGILTVDEHRNAILPQRFAHNMRELNIQT